MSELSEASLLTSMRRAPLQFPKIYNYIRALATPQKAQRLGWASQETPLAGAAAQSRVTLEMNSFRDFVGTPEMNVTVLPVVKVRRTGTGKNVVLPD